MDNLTCNLFSFLLSISNELVDELMVYYFTQGAALESLAIESSNVLEMSLAPIHLLPTKVSSISTTNENKGVTITRSHEVPGKSSTNGTSSAVRKSGSLSLDVLAKAKKT
ncbi:hypothetical protein CMV_003280 [Castanea mollissima]|uniref:Uncharacterized protein n=1 Tax=Castanea mollissima TaxID=60419 RepID=A0A8J4RTL3_9ROSI|nr:hypothetical protein CMV_003280 [Castanea mollissima]